MKSLKRIKALTMRELKDDFSSPLVYVLTGLFSLLMGWLFFNYLVISKNMTSSSLIESVFNPIFGNMNFIFLFFCPLITMRSFSEERKNGTLDLLFRSRLTHLQIILGKWFSTLIVSLFMISVTLILPLILAISGYSQWGMVMTSYLGIVLSIMCYLTVGLFASSLTESPLISAITSFCFLLVIMLLVLSANASGNYIVGQILSYLSIPFHYESFVRGAIKSYNLVFFASFCSFFIYLTHKSLDSRNW